MQKVKNKEKRKNRTKGKSKDQINSSCVFDRILAGDTSVVRAKFFSLFKQGIFSFLPSDRLSMISDDISHDIFLDLWQKEPEQEEVISPSLYFKNMVKFRSWRECRHYSRLTERDFAQHDINTESSNSEWAPPVNPPNPYKSDPEQVLLELEVQQTVEALPSLVGSSEAKRAHEYQRILEAQLNGLKISSQHGSMLGIPDKKVASIKHQAIDCAKSILAQADEEIAKRQQVYKDQKGKKWKGKRLTSEERKALYKDPHAQEKEPRTIRVWKVIKGGKHDSYDSVAQTQSTSFPKKKNIKLLVLP